LEVPRSDDVDKSRFLDGRLLDFEVTPVVSDTPSNWDGILIGLKLNKIKIVIYQIKVLSQYFSFKLTYQIKIVMTSLF
jgi:hypothetical protein